MKTKSIPRKMISTRLLKLKAMLLSEHSTMMFNHVDAGYMRQRAKEEVLSNGNLELAAALILLADIKDTCESKTS